MWKNTASIAALPLQVWLRECATMLRYTNTDYLVLDNVWVCTSSKKKGRCTNL